MKHTEIQDLIPLLALGGMADSERAELETHLATCQSCRALLTEYAFVAEELQAEVPQLQPSAQLESRLMQRVPMRPTQANALPAFKQPPTAPKPAPAVKGTPRKPGFWQQPVPVARWAFAFAALIALLLLGVSGMLALQVQRTGGLNANQVAQLFASNQRKFVELTVGSPGQGEQLEGYVYLSPENPTALVWFNNLKQLDADHVYQIWLRKDTQRISAGLFHAGMDGHAMVIINAPKMLGNYTDIGVTVEPATGSPGPTTPRVIGGKLD